MAPELVQALRPHINSRSITLPHGGPKDDDGCEDAPNVYSGRSLQGAYDKRLSGSTRRLTHCSLMGRDTQHNTPDDLVSRAFN